MLLFFYTSTQAQHFSLKGKINGINNQYIYFSHAGSANDRIWDSVIIKNNAFQFNGTLIGQAKCYITTKKDNRTDPIDSHVVTPFYIASGTIFITLDKNDFKHCIITGSRPQKEWESFNKQNQPINNKLNQLGGIADSLVALNEKAIDTVTAQKLQQQMAKIEIERQTYIATLRERDKKFIVTHTTSLAATVLLDATQNIYNVESLQNVFYKMPKVHQQSFWGKEIQKNIDGLLMGSIGYTATNFIAKELRGDTVRLDAYKGKYVLLDFWASWCVPCRQGNPELLQLYNTYKNSGIEFISIADDDGAADKWKAAVEKDGIGAWKHILRGSNPTLKDNPNDLSDLYGVHFLPFQILIGPDGKINKRFGDRALPNKQLPIVLKQIFSK